MTATIIAFPTMIERDDAQFIRTGQTSYTWAGAESSALYDALWASGMPARLLPRIAVLAGSGWRHGSLERRRDMRASPDAGFPSCDMPPSRGC